MDAMQRFNRISAVICLLLSCAPRAYAQDNRHGETMGAAVAQTKLAGVYQHGHSGLQDPAKALAGFHRAASQGDVEAQYNLAKMYEDQDSVLFDYSKAHSWYRLAPPTGIAVRKAAWDSCSNLEKAWRKAGCRRICGTALPFQTEIKPPHFGGILWQVILSPTKF